MPDWSFHHPTFISFGTGILQKAPTLIEGDRIAVITSPGFTRRGVTSQLRQSFGARLVEVVDTVQPNPDIDDIDEMAARLKPLRPDCLVGFGGGSSLDTAKALARLLVDPQQPTLGEYFRDNKPFGREESLPVVAIPTTAGTGAEVTPFATIWDFQAKKKYSLSETDIHPEQAIIDPGLASTLPRRITISSGLDTISHAFESIWNQNANPISLSFATQALVLAWEALPQLIDDGDAGTARARMAQASLLAGLAISQTRTALAHSMSYPLTTHFGLPHGVACSFSLAELLRFNAATDDGRLQRVATVLGYAEAGDLANALDEFLLEVGADELFAECVPTVSEVLSLTGEMYTPERAENNMRPATDTDMAALVESAAEAMLR